MPRHPRSRPLILLTAVCVVAYFPSLMAVCRGDFPFSSDTIAAFGPWREFAAQSLRKGIFPLWNPHVFCGMPFMANGQSAVLYPPNLVYLLLPLPWALLVDALAHNILLACGGYLLARQLTLDRASSFFTAALLALGQSVSARINVGHITWHDTRAWIPWLLLATLLFLKHGKNRHGLAGAAICGLMMSAGHPQEAIFGIGLTAGMATLFFLVSRQHVHVSLASVIGFSLLAALLCAPAILPLADAARETSRSAGLNYRFATIGSGNWSSLVRMLLPDFFGGNRATQWSLVFYPHEEAASVGVLAFVLAWGAPFWVAGNARKIWKNKAVTILTTVMVLALVMALGRFTRIYHWAFLHLPLVREVRIPVRWLELWYFSAALLAGLAFRAVSHRIHTRQCMALDRVILLLSGACFMTCAWLASTKVGDDLWMKTAQWNARRGLLEMQETAAIFRQAAVASSLLGGLWLAAFAFLIWRWKKSPSNRWRHGVIAVAVLQLVTLFWNESRPFSNSEYQRSARWPQELTAKFKPGERWVSAWSDQWKSHAWTGGVPAGVDLYNGYDPFTPRRFFRLASQMEGHWFFDNQYQPDTYGPLLRVAGVTNVLAAPYENPPIISGDHSTRVAKSGLWSLWRYHNAWPRVYLTTQIVQAGENEQTELLDVLSRQKYALQFPVVTSPAEFPQVKTAAAAGNVAGWTRSLNQMTIELRTQRDAALVIGENYWPGWRAYAATATGTQELPVRCVNLQFRGVEVPVGTTSINMVYAPQAWRLALFLGLLGIGAATATLFCLKRHP